jgi:hypothetical protein
MMGLKANVDFVAMLGDAWWIDERAKKPTPGLNKSGQEPQCSYNDARKQREHRTKARKIHQNVHGFAGGVSLPSVDMSIKSLVGYITTQTDED